MGEREVCEEVIYELTQPEDGRADKSAETGNNPAEPQNRYSYPDAVGDNEEEVRLEVL